MTTTTSTLHNNIVPAIQLMKSWSSLTRLKRLTLSLTTSLLATVFRTSRPALSILPGASACSSSSRSSGSHHHHVTASPAANAMTAGGAIETANGDHLDDGAGSSKATSSSTLSSAMNKLYQLATSTTTITTTTTTNSKRVEEGDDDVHTRMAFASGVPVIQRRSASIADSTSAAATATAAVSTYSSRVVTGAGSSLGHNVALLSRPSLTTAASSFTVAAGRSMSSQSLRAASSSSSNNHTFQSQPSQSRPFSQNPKSFSSSASSSSSSKLSSSRSQNAIALLPSYLIDARAIQKYHPITCPEGALQLSVAENQLSELEILDDNNSKVIGLVEEGSGDTVHTKGGNSGEEGMTLVDVLSQLASSAVIRPSQQSTETATAATASVFETEMIYYQPTQGVPGLRTAMANYLQRLLVSPSMSLSSSSTTATNDDVPQMHPDGIILGAGCNAVLENLCMCLAEPGEAVMIPTPYYAAFEFDLVARAGELYVVYILLCIQSVVYGYLYLNEK